MIRLARSARVKSWMQSRRLASLPLRRFVGGSDLEQTIETVRQLATEKIRASLFYMGEYVSDADEIRRTVQQKIAAATMLAENGFESHVSIDPTQIGHLVSSSLMLQNARSIGRAIASAASRRNATGRDLLMLDMEDDTCVDDTIALARQLTADKLPVGLTLQAYLRRTESDLRSLSTSGMTIRLVKGAFAAGPAIAYRDRHQIDQNYLRLSAVMLSPEARDAGLFPSFATHDHRLIEEIVSLAAANEWSPEQFEFEMLLGVRPDLQRSLAFRGLRVRAYVPFGRDWWPYVARRLGEKPASIMLLLRSMAGTRRPEAE